MLGLHWGQRTGVQGSALRETHAARQVPLKFSGEKKETSLFLLGDFSPAAPFRLPHAPPSRHAYHFQWAYAAQHAAQGEADDKATRKQDFVFWRVMWPLGAQVRLVQPAPCRPRPLKASPSALGPSTAPLPSMGAIFIALARRARELWPDERLLRNPGRRRLPSARLGAPRHCHCLRGEQLCHGVALTRLLSPGAGHVPNIGPVACVQTPTPLSGLGSQAGWSTVRWSCRLTEALCALPWPLAPAVTLDVESGGSAPEE